MLSVVFTRCSGHWSTVQLLLCVFFSEDSVPSSAGCLLNVEASCTTEEVIFIV